MMNIEKQFRFCFAFVAFFNGMGEGKMVLYIQYIDKILTKLITIFVTEIHINKIIF